MNSERAHATGPLSVTIELAAEQVDRIDEWREKRHHPCSRPEAVRQLVDIGTHCEPYVAKLLKHLEQVAEDEHREVRETVAALRRALGEAEAALGGAPD